MPTPKPNNLQLEAVVKEVKRLRSLLETTFKEIDPAPSWEQEQEWHELNPSPRTRHTERMRQFRNTVVEPLGQDLELKIRLGCVEPNDIYSALAELANECAIRRAEILGGQRNGTL